MPKRVSHRTMATIVASVSVAVCTSLLTVVPAAAGPSNDRPKVRTIKSVPVSKVHAKGLKKKSLGNALKFTPQQLPKRGATVESALSDKWSASAGGLSVRTTTGKGAGRSIGVTPLGQTAKSSVTGVGPVFEVTQSDAPPPASPGAAATTPTSTPTPSANTPTPTQSVDSGKAGDPLGTPLEIKVDYAQFANAFGGAWASRLKLVKLDDCKTTKTGVDCSKAEPLKTTHDFGSQTLTASIPAGAAQKSMMVTAAAAASGEQGDYTATPMAPSSSWAAGNQSGDFTWSYPMDAPDGLGGPTPDLAINYSSGSVDGKSSVTNDQASWLGEGFSLDPGFVERSYEPCRQVKEGDSTSTAPSDVGDLCWRDDNLTMSINGKSSQLVHDGSTNQWRMKSDDGTRIEQITTAGINDDNDGEYWRVTTPDGTKYYYGRNERFAGDTHKTNSVSTVPVYGSRAGEPCRGGSFATSVCDQGWRWGLDYVVDPHGNTMSLFYDQEQNKYGSNKNTTVRGYDRAAVLTSIEYGTRAGTENDSAAPMKVDFTTAERCIDDTFDCNSTMTQANASHWPEVPFDQICTSTTTCPDTFSPTFFSRKRLTTVATFVANGSGYDPVNEWKLTQELPAIDQSPTIHSLLLTQIQQTGKAGADVSLPPVTFNHQLMDNRVDDNSGISTFRRYRVSGVFNGTGGTIAVNYSQPDCTATNKPALTALDTNTKRCFPVWFQPDWTSTRQIEFFHKYRVDSIGENDNTGGALTKSTKYTYTGGDGWHYTDNSIERPKYRTWSEWRGYQSVSTEVGVTNKTYTNTLYMRGMSGNKKQAGGTWTVNVTDPQSGGASSLQDDDQLAGFERRTVTKLGASGAVVDMSINTPWTSAATATQGTTKAYIVDVGQSDVKTWLPASSTYRTARDTATFNTRGQVVTELDAGDTAITTDDQCTKTTYATNSTDGMFDFPATEITIAGTCSATPASAADVISATRTSYDGGTVGAAPTKGDPTKAESASGWTSGGGISYQTDSTSAYDNYGRVTSDKDATGEETTTAYTPAAGPATKVTSTNPLGQTTTAALNNVGAPTRQTDVAGAKTDYKYDSLGRVTSVWGPGRDQDGGDSATAKFTYRVSTTEANAVTTETLNNAGDYVMSVAFYDGFLRERSSQSPSPGPSGGREITDKSYDDHGWVTSDRGPYFNSSPVDTNLVVHAENQINSYTNYAYDLAGRVTTESLASYGAVKFSTITAYGGDRVSVTPPAGGTATTTVSDARGQTTSLLQYLGATPTGSADTTTYGYSKRGELTKVTDSSGTIWNKTYDIRGQLVTDSDPDKGTTTFTYDSLGQQVTSTDARSFTLWSKYDKLGRQTELRDDNATGVLRSAWVYDTAREGALTSSTRYDGGNAYVNEVTAYDPAGQPTSSRVVIPAAEGLLAGSYVTGADYNVDGSVKKITQPAIDDPTPEELSYTYDALGNPKTLTGFTPLVTGTTYSSLGHLMQRVLDTTPGKSVSDTRDYDLATNRTIAREVGLQGTATAPKMDLRYTYDDAGNVTKLNDVAAGDTNQTSSSTWRQCFTYDYLQRMTAAYTSSGNSCAAPTTANLGTEAPYWDAYTFAKSGNRTKVVSVRKPAATLVTTTHTSTFPSATAARPHAVTSTAKSGGGTGTESYVYDADGNLSKRSTSASVGKNIVFDREGREKTVTDIATGKVTTYLYDADGNRLIQRDDTDNSTTLFLASGEVTSKAGARTTTRTYTMGGEAIATRDATGVKLMATDNNGTPLISVDATTQAFEKRRYSPYGELLQAPASWPSTRGYLNKTTDNTGTTHLGAREYDPAASRFISVDPIGDGSDPQQLNGYAYANNSPITSTDPSGLQTDPRESQPGHHYGAGTVSKRISALAAAANRHYDQQRARAKARARAHQLQAAAKAALKKQLSHGGFLGLKDLGRDLKKVGSAVLGIDDAKGCFAHGQVGSCFWTAANVVIAVCTVGTAGFCGTAKGAEVAARATDVGVNATKAERLTGAAHMCSFSGATLVLMADGTKKPIEDVRVGDKVVATDPETGEQVGKTVTHLWVHEDTLTDLVLDDGTALTTTENHPYWSVDDQRFERADQLDPGERVLGAGGRSVAVSGLRLATARNGLAYNLTVEGIHTYHVGDDAILVHNTCGGLVPAAGLDGAGKVHGPLPRPADLAKFDRESLVVLRGQLETSVQTRIAKTVELGSDYGHSARQAEEQQLIHSINNLLKN